MELAVSMKERIDGVGEVAAIDVCILVLRVACVVFSMSNTMSFARSIWACEDKKGKS